MFTFKRKSTRPSPRRSKSDLCISAVLAGNHKNRCWQISFRVSTDTMKKLRLLPNDKVVATCDPVNNRHTLTRVHNDEGNQISTRQSKTSYYGQVRFSCSRDELEALGLLNGEDNSNRIEADLIETDGASGVFAAK